MREARERVITCPRGSGGEAPRYAGGLGGGSPPACIGTWRACIGLVGELLLALLELVLKRKNTFFRTRRKRQQGEEMWVGVGRRWVEVGEEGEEEVVQKWKEEARSRISGANLRRRESM